MHKPGTYVWQSHSSSSSVQANGRDVTSGLALESKSGSLISVTVDQDAATIAFNLDGQHVYTITGVGHKDLTPAAMVYYASSRLTLKSVERAPDASAPQSIAGMPLATTVHPVTPHLRPRRHVVLLQRAQLTEVPVPERY